ncbi:MAG: ABC transporter permease [Peptococcaceae bacterium]|nr:ABC transporter permease [Peptococcaceae bacterium]
MTSILELLRCEFRKTRRRYLIAAALIMTVLQLCWCLYGECTEEIVTHGWMLFLYQFPLVNAIFLPLLSMMIASGLCDIEHKGTMLKQLFTCTERNRLFDAKLLYGLLLITACVLLSWMVIVLYGFLHRFEGPFPLKLYLLYFLFTLCPTIMIYLIQHTLSILFQNQTIPCFTGIIGTFCGVFSMFLQNIPWLRKLLPWGHYGALQFVGMFGWTKETRYEYVYFETMHTDWLFFLALILSACLLYLIGRNLFSRKEV